MPYYNPFIPNAPGTEKPPPSGHGLTDYIGKAVDWLGSKGNKEDFTVPGAEKRSGRYGRYAEQFGGFQTPTVDPEAYEFWKRKMRGEDSLSQRFYDQAAGKNRQFALAQAATGRGNSALQARLASQSMGRANADAASGAATAGIQERAAAGQLAAQMSGQNLAAALQAQGLRQQGVLGAEGLDLRQAIAQMQGNMGYAGMPTNAERYVGMGTGIAGAIMAGG